MAGTSGCIPDYHVNFFGRLSASRRSTIAASEAAPQIDTNEQIYDAPLPPLKTAVRVPKPDRIRELFEENQNLIRGLSSGNVETYLAIVKERFAEVRRDRAAACEELSQKQMQAEHCQVEHIEPGEAEQRDQDEVEHHDQYHKINSK